VAHPPKHTAVAALYIARQQAKVARVDGGEALVRWAEGREELRGALDVREQVFCREQGVPRAEEIDGRDGEALHVVALEPVGQRVIGTLRLLVASDEGKVGRVAVDREWRGRGIASRMLELALALARERGCVRVRLAAQTAATGLYEQAGFKVESEAFDEAGIPHVWMGLALGSGPTATARPGR
jgi:predicted GNAT family N-acyltransferase